MSGEVIALVLEGYDPEQIANGQLLAAAPELLEQLEEALAILDVSVTMDKFLFGVDHDIPLAAHVELVRRNAAVAIRRARGQS